ncbi:MAG: transglycosylase domain-containing protein, partial [Persicimonas sp.]
MLHRTLHILHRNVIHFIRLAWGKAAIALLLLLSGGLIAAWAVPLPDRLGERDSTVVTWDDGEPAHVMLSEDDKLRMPVSLDRLDEDYVDALLGLEDERFYMHPGVDPIAIVRAAISNATNGRVVSGGSTITMQLVRLLEPRPRTLRSKVIEAFRAMQLEMHLSKEEILEAYLRFVPYGRNIEGVESAALAYYGETTEALSEGQIATLLAVPQAPGTRHPSEANAERLREGRRDIARTLYKEGLLFDRAEDPEFGVDEALRQVAAEPVPESFTSVPRELPHVASWLRASEPDRDRFVTTLDESTQETVEHLVAEREAEAARGAVDNVAVVLTEHETGAVRALVGNFDFSLKRSGGQIPAFDVARSTGSLLKPFVYADAIDGGKTTPRQRVPDVPKSFGHYTPHNFEYRYNGLVRMEDALAQSLNVPLVELLRRVGVDEFASTLRRLGLRRFNPKPGDQGLSMAVGGVEATPIEVTRLYAALANDGRPTPVSVLADQVDQERYRPVFGEGASWMARDALRRRDRPDFPGRGADLGPRA